MSPTNGTMGNESSHPLRKRDWLVLGGLGTSAFLVLAVISEVSRTASYVIGAAALVAILLRLFVLRRGA